MQQQNYSLSALAKRDAREDPFAKSGDSTQRAPKQPDDDDTQSRTVHKPVLQEHRDDAGVESVEELLERIRKGFE
jgi:phage portal protein BeeE